MATFKHSLRTAWHFVLRLLTRGPIPTCPSAPKRILLVNGAHIGDVVIATSLLPVLKRAFPNAEIGFLTGTWSHAVVHDHPDVSHTHCVDHWRMNRQIPGFLAKRVHYWKTRRRALQEIPMTSPCTCTPGAPTFFLSLGKLEYPCERPSAADSLRPSQTCSPTIQNTNDLSIRASVSCNCSTHSG